MKTRALSGPGTNKDRRVVRPRAWILLKRRATDLNPSKVKKFISITFQNSLFFWGIISCKKLISEYPNGKLTYRIFYK